MGSTVISKSWISTRGVDSNCPVQSAKGKPVITQTTGLPHALTYHDQCHGWTGNTTPTDMKSIY